MCYDIAFAASFDALLESLSDIEYEQNFRDSYELREHLQAQAFGRHPVLLQEDGRYKLQLFEWGVIADYMNTPEKIKKMRSGMCNARAEKIVADRQSYWHRLRRHRCLVPVTGIFEHREVKGYRHKIPYHIALRNRSLFYLPALYHYPARADVETGEITGTFTIVTRAANPVMAQIHNSGDQAGRMPLFLPKEEERRWLQPDLSDEDLSALLAYELPASELDYHPVYTIRTTKERPDGGDRMDKYDWPGLPPLGVDSVAVQGGLF